ncbi:High-affinity branched-chain amino acid transport ATP-binding protein LivF [Variovorax boronicumulans]|uniref:ABC transporter ATP-binding protein n=1 Tax=Variovorax boronicumulans TaxID=436515 RepID=UPI000BB3E365|nr:ABC transporter ATP-binding protein [Variovorax boronicumulans]PBI87793.1 High-affinity branched-chain amino acid transport ATP-binding protein LivF [Variovorax boronicumulans]
MTHRLDIRDLAVSYGRTAVVHGIDLHVDAGEMVALLGANGAGKTSILRAISHQQVTARGTLRFEDVDIINLPPPSIAALGIAHVPEGRGTFADLTVLENLRVGAIRRRDKDGIEQDIAKMQTLFPKLASRAKQTAGTLSGGEQQMLAIARALMMRPKMLLLDEPSFGIAPRVTQEIYELLRELRARERLTALIVEQNANIALDLVDRAYVLESGRITAQGTPAALREDDTVRQSYLGH